MFIWMAYSHGIARVMLASFQTQKSIYASKNDNQEEITTYLKLIF